ncbi:sulfotransferase family protein [Dyella dinghuensis]|uniref:Sulfotransferase family protein n=2 Tax=Dyella dinghuensis TaxID=1920169 RepID=A0A432LWE9_9GAMM|nr:sulfotransferase family protein [Dyella dinghuensis]
MEQQNWSQAVTHLRQAIQLAPECAEYVVQWAKVLSLTNTCGEALRMANRAASLTLSDPLLLDTLGVIYTRCHAHERAALAFREAALRAPLNASFRFNYANALMYAGDNDAAAGELETVIALNPGHGLAHFMLSRLHRQTTMVNHLTRLQTLANQTPRGTSAHVYAHMALGKEYEDIGEYAHAWEHYRQGKASVPPLHVNSQQHDDALFDALHVAFDAPHSEMDGCRTDEAIFVVGMPRTGTTLVERILSNHPYVYGAGELPNFGLAVKQLSSTQTPHLLDGETITQAAFLRRLELGERYLSSTRPQTDGKPRFVDKLPHNFLYIGFIAQALPRAKIICLRRHPLDTCLSNFRELFVQGSPFHDYSLDLMKTGHYYVRFHRLMAYWKRLFPDRILELNYEDLVTEQEFTTRNLLAYCDLPWRDSCLHHHENSAPVTTASSVQVREPLHRGSMGRWKNYSPYLEELCALLHDAGVVWND